MRTGAIALSPTLIHHLFNSSDVEDQWFLIRTLGYFNRPIVVAALAEFLVSTSVEELQVEVTKALTGLGGQAIAALTDLLKSPAIDQKILAARTLSKIRRGAVIEPLLGVAADPDKRLRVIAIEALGSFHDPRVTPVLLSALTDEAPVAVEAIRALGRRSDLLEETDLLRLLQRCLSSADREIAQESAIALGRLGSRLGSRLEPRASKDAIAVILGQFITQPAPAQVKVAAVRALGWIDTPAAVLSLARAFESPFPMVMPETRREIARSLGQTRSAQLKPAAAEPLTAWVQSLASDQSEPGCDRSEISGAFAIKQTVVSSLAQLGATEAIGSLIPLLGDADDRIRMHALSALKQIDPRTAQAEVQNYLSAAETPPLLREKVAASLSAW